MNIILKFRSALTEPGKRRKITFASLFTLLAISPFFLYLHLGRIGHDESAYMFIAANIGDVPDNLALIGAPGIYYLLSLIFSIFGESFYVARSAVFISYALSAILLFFIGRKLWDQKEGMLASLLFQVGVLIPAFDGQYLLMEPFMVFSLLLGVFFFLKSEKNAIYLVLSGLAVGLSILFKQFAGLLLLGIVAFYLCGLWPRENRTREWIGNSVKELSLLCFGVLIPILAIAVYFWAIGGFYDFIQDTVLRYILHYGRRFDLLSTAYMFASYSIVWIFSAVSVLAITYQFVTKRGWNKELFVAIWLVFSLYALSYRQFGHYMLTILPSACLLASLSLNKAYPKLLSISQIRNSLSQRQYVGIFAVVCAFALTLSTVLFIAYQEQEYQADLSLCADKIETANYIKDHTEEDEKIFGFPSATSIHFLSGRHPPVRIFQIHPVWTPDENAEREVIDRLEESNLNYIVVNNRKANVPGTKVITNTTFRQIAQYIQDNYVIEKSIGNFDIYKRPP